MEHDEKNRDLSSEVEESAKSIKCKGKKRRQGSNRVAAYRPGCSWMDPYQDQNINEDQSTSSSDEDQSTSSLDEDLKRAIAESLKDMEDRVTHRSI
ncbi:unnamed protein product [Leptosia nina]|uniref:Uncharacterized protein n=1 Tax=Leptosia nina TaxID=320188 RepID=A0AAV1K2J0_9NEOP